MAEWLVEEGIGEHRAALMEGDGIIAARLDWPGPLAAGLIEDAVLLSRATGSTRGSARFANGEEALVDGLPRDAREGAPLRLEVTRAAMWEKSRRKPAHSRVTSRPPRPATTLAEAVGGKVVRHFEGWDELWSDAVTGVLEFSGGALEFSPTSAFTAIDVDGALPSRELALAAVPELAKAIRRFDLSGSIVVDFPTLSAKTDRQSVDRALAKALTGWPHERTAMNGFGLVQLVARRERASLLELVRRWPDAAARMLLRRAERVTEPGTLLLTANSRVKAAFWGDWESELARRTGRTIAWRIDDALAYNASFAQAVAP